MREREIEREIEREKRVTINGLAVAVRFPLKYSP